MPFDPVRLTAALDAPDDELLVRLRRCLELVRRLTSAQLFKGKAPIGVDLVSAPDGGVDFVVQAPVDELQMTGVLATFRQLWMSGEPA